MTFMSTAGRAPVPSAGAPGPFGALRMTPGRWLALAVGVPVALALIGWTGFGLIASVARGSYPFSYTFPVHDGQVALNISAGDITLRQAPGSDTARLTGVVQYGLARPDISTVTTPTSADVSLNCSANIAGNCAMSSHLDVPARTGLTLWSNGGDIAAAGLSSGMTLWAAGGNVTATNLVGELRLDTGGGDLVGAGLTGTLQLTTDGGNINGSNWTGSGTMRVDTGGGDLSVNGLNGTLQLSTEGGNVAVGGMASGVVTVNSGGGDVALAFTQVPQSLDITAEGGNVAVILPPGSTTYGLSLPDTAGGNVSYPPTLVSPHSHHKITIDSGGGDITVSQG